MKADQKQRKVLTVLAEGDLFNELSYLPRVKTLQRKLGRFLRNSREGHLYDYFLYLLSFLSCLQFISTTYVDNIFQQNIELSFAAIFSLDWMIRLFVADAKWANLSRLYFIFSLYCVCII